jgi:hypothetical protein
VFIVGILGTIAYMYTFAIKDLKKENIANPQIRAWAKAGISGLAFFIWAFFLGGPFAQINFHEPIGTILILVFTFVNPFLYDYIPFPETTANLSIFNIKTVKASSDEVFGYVSSITILNRCADDVNLGKFRLYWRTFWHQEREAATYNYTGGPIKSTEEVSIDLKLRFHENPKAEIHILKIETSLGIVQSSPIKKP